MKVTFYLYLTFNLKFNNVPKQLTGKKNWSLSKQRKDSEQFNYLTVRADKKENRLF